MPNSPPLFFSVVLATVGSTSLLAADPSREIPLPDIADVSPDARELNVSVKALELTLTPEEASRKFSKIIELDSSQPAVLSPNEGFLLFHPHTRGLDLLTMPKIVTAPGQKNRIEVGRDFVYPDPDHVPAGPGDTAAFLTTTTGVKIDLAVSPTQNPGIIQINLDPSIRELKEFTAAKTGGKPEIPVFTTRGRPISGKFQNGSYFLLETIADEQFVQDKIPLLGDIPLLGRAFRKSETVPITRITAIQVLVSEAR